jgi:hypothetical protein
MSRSASRAPGPPMPPDGVAPVLLPGPSGAGVFTPI